MTNRTKSKFTSHCRIAAKTNFLVLLLFLICFAHARYSSRMIDRFLNWGDHGKPKSGKIKGRCQPPLHPSIATRSALPSIFQGLFYIADPDLQQDTAFTERGGWGWGELGYHSMGDNLPQTKFQQCFLNRRLDPSLKKSWIRPCYKPLYLIQYSKSCSF